MTRGIDHLVLCVRDLDAARAFYRRLGFTLTPKALHPWGTGNSLAQFRGSFLEILAVAEPAKIAPPEPGGFSFGWFNASFLEKREGFSMLVLQTQDARADSRAFQAAGLDAYPPFYFERQAKLPDGTQAMVAFTTAFVADPRMPEAGFFTCQQHSPQHFWRPEYQKHANGALGVTEAMMRAPDPLAFAEFFAGLQDKDAVRPSPGRLDVAMGDGRLTVLDPRGIAARFPGMEFAGAKDGPVFVGYRVKVADLAAAGALLKKNGVAHRRVGDALVVGPREAFGAAVEFARA
jgi:catechol 2,3-dioxygenase-like lactoylglutathione lyase family enzyme